MPERQGLPAARNAVGCDSKSSLKAEMSFLDIPPEIRLQIYVHLFTLSPIDFVPPTGYDSPIEQSNPPSRYASQTHLAILFTCHLIHAEAGPIAFRGTPFRGLSLRSVPASQLPKNDTYNSTFASSEERDIAALHPRRLPERQAIIRLFQRPPLSLSFVSHVSLSTEAIESITPDAHWSSDLRRDQGQERMARFALAVPNVTTVVLRSAVSRMNWFTSLAILELCKLRVIVAVDGRATRENHPARRIWWWRELEKHGPFAWEKEYSKTGEVREREQGRREGHVRLAGEGRACVEFFQRPLQRRWVTCVNDRENPWEGNRVHVHLHHCIPEDAEERVSTQWTDKCPEPSKIRHKNKIAIRV